MITLYLRSYAILLDDDSLDSFLIIAVVCYLQFERHEYFVFIRNLSLNNDCVSITGHQIPMETARKRKMPSSCSSLKVYVYQDGQMISEPSITVSFVDIQLPNPWKLNNKKERRYVSAISIDFYHRLGGVVYKQVFWNRLDPQILSRVTLLPIMHPRK